MRTIAFVLMVSATCLLHANTTLFEAGNNAYVQGNYPQAIESYEALLNILDDGKVHYNLGNAYYKTGDYARAILHYEKSLKHFPNDKDIQHNLAIANLQTIDKIDPRPEFFLLTWWKNIASIFNADTWAVLFLIILWLSVLIFLAFVLTASGLKKLIFLSGTASFTLSVILLLLTITQHLYETSQNNAIILAPSASVKSAPLTGGTDLFIIHEGLKVKILDTENDWIRICLPDGKEGWVPTGMAGII